MRIRFATFIVMLVVCTAIGIYVQAAELPIRTVLPSVKTKKSRKRHRVDLAHY